MTDNDHPGKSCREDDPTVPMIMLAPATAEEGKEGGGCEGTKRISLGRAAQSGNTDLLQPAVQGLQGSSPQDGSLERTETGKRLC